MMVGTRDEIFRLDWSRLSSQVELLGIKGFGALIVVGLLRNEGRILLNGKAVIAVITDSREGIATHHGVIMGTRGNLLLVGRRNMRVVQGPVVRVIGIYVRCSRLLLIIEFLQKGAARGVVIVVKGVRKRGGLRGPVRSLPGGMDVWMGVVGVGGKDVADSIVDVCLAVVHVDGMLFWCVGGGAVRVGGVWVESGRVHGARMLWQ